MGASKLHVSHQHSWGCRHYCEAHAAPQYLLTKLVGSRNFQRAMCNENAMPYRFEEADLIFRQMYMVGLNGWAFGRLGHHR